MDLRKNLSNFWDWSQVPLRGLGACVVVLCIVLTTIFAYSAWSASHAVAKDTAQLTELALRNHALQVTNNNLLGQYKAEEARLASAGKTQIAFALYIIEVDGLLCQAVQVSCPAFVVPK